MVCSCLMISCALCFINALTTAAKRSIIAAGDRALMKPALKWEARVEKGKDKPEDFFSPTPATYGEVECATTSDDSVTPRSASSAVSAVVRKPCVASLFCERNAR